MKKNIGIYIHIPFCVQKCYYCDFNSFAMKEDKFKDYFESLEKEIISYKDKLNSHIISTIYIGGGTPSIVSATFIENILYLLYENFNVSNNPEITIESNPGSITRDKLISYKKIGINRLSIGVQALQNEMLEKIGRVHTVEEFTDNYKLARELGFNNINLDLIFALPDQTLKIWDETLRAIVNLNPEHISCYGLKIEEGTKFFEYLKNNKLNTISDELDREMYYLAKEIFKMSGYEQYEISNFSKKGFMSKHNLVYWNAGEYIGFGAGAHSYFNKKRYNNVYTIEKYVNLMSCCQKIIENEEAILEKDEISEYIILRLRLIDGIDIGEFYKKFNIQILDLYGSQIKKLIKDNLIKINNNKITLSTKGLDLANSVFIEFI